MNWHVTHGRISRGLISRTPRRRKVAVLGVLLAVLLVSACASPPSVVPLLRVSASAVDAERARLATDLTRLAQSYDQRRQLLKSGFEADVNARPSMDAKWVTRGVTAYVAARELVLRDELAAAGNLQTRQANLGHVSEALRRAVVLIEQQDHLLMRVPDLRRWPNESTTQGDLP